MVLVTPAPARVAVLVEGSLEGELLGVVGEVLPLLALSTGPGGEHLLETVLPLTLS